MADDQPRIRPEVVQAVFSALTDMDPGKLAGLTSSGITEAERKQAEELYLAGMLASQEHGERRREVWQVLIARDWSSPPSWGGAIDDLDLGELLELLAGVVVIGHR
jgi:hypothetical protein